MLIYEQVGDTLYCLHRSILCRDSQSAFATMLDRAEGKSDETTIVLGQVTSEEFETFLTALYPGYAASMP